MHDFDDRDEKKFPHRYGKHDSDNKKDGINRNSFKKFFNL